MASTTITPIPYGSGTIDLAQQKDITTVFMGNNKFVNFYAQSNPNIVYAHVVNVSGLNGGTASATNGPQFAFPSPAARVRAWRMSDTRLMVLLGNDLRVLEIDGQDNIAMRSASLINYCTVPLWRGANGAASTSYTSEILTDIHQGAGLVVHRNTDTSMFVVMKANATPYSSFNSSVSSSGLFVVTFDPVADTLTSVKTNSLSETGFPQPQYGNSSSQGYGIVGHAHVRFADIPNSENKLIYMIGANSGNATITRIARSPYLYWAGVVTPTGQITLLPTTGIPTTSYTADTPHITAVMPLGDNKYLGFTDARSFLYHNGTQWSSSRTIFASSGAEAFVTGAYAIDDTYFAITFAEAPVNTATGSFRDTLNLLAANQYIRIVRYVDQNFAEVSPATETYTNFSMGVPLNIEGKFMEKIGPNTLAYYTKSSATATDARINIRSIFGA